jgi:DNA primase
VASTSAPSVPGRVAAIEECVPLLRAVRDPLARDLYVDKLAQLLKVDTQLVQRSLRTQPAIVKARDVEPAPIEVVTRPVQQRRVPLTHEKLLSFLAQHSKFLPRIDDEILAALRDDMVRALIKQMRDRGSFDPAAVLAECPAEISDTVAHCIGSDEYAGVENPQKLFEQIILSIRFPADLGALMHERTVAIAAGDRELIEKLNARIMAVSRRSSR